MSDLLHKIGPVPGPTGLAYITAGREFNAGTSSEISLTQPISERYKQIAKLKPTPNHPLGFPVGGIFA